MAIQGRKKVDLSIEEVLNRCTELDIFNAFMPWKWELNQACLSPFPRPGKGYEKNPSLIIGNKFGNITFVDLGLSLKGDCFKFVKELECLPTLDATLRIIDSKLNLGISNGISSENKPIIQEKQPEITKKNSLIQVITRKFTNEELQWWNTYYQDIEDLKREEIYSIKKVYLNKKLLSVNDLRFGYYYKGTWKIYQPTENKRKKWLTNTPLTYLEGKSNIQNCNTAWVTKSKKDKMCLLKLFSCVAATQNESIGCFSKENVEFLRNNSKKQVILYDSDDSGVRSCQKITKEFDFLYCNPPRKYLPEVKDFSDMLKIHGIKAIEEHFKEKGLI